MNNVKNGAAGVAGQFNQPSSTARELAMYAHLNRLTELNDVLRSTRDRLNSMHMRTFGPVPMDATAAVEPAPPNGHMPTLERNISDAHSLINQINGIINEIESAI